MFYTYILHSHNFDRYYVGQTNNIEKRFERHQNGYVKSTKPYRPWVLSFYEEFDSRAKAMKRETYLKSLKSKTALMNIIEASR